MTERQKIKNNGLMPNVVEQETSIIMPVNCIINKNRSIIRSSLELKQNIQMYNITMH